MLDFRGSPAPCRGSRIRLSSLLFGFVLAATSATAAVNDVIGTIPNPAPETNAQFGYSVDGYDGDILVGAPLADANGHTDSGVAYRFTIPGNLVYTLNNPLPSNDDQYGF